MKYSFTENDLKQYAGTWNPKLNYYLWGAGLEGTRAVKMLGNRIKIDGMIDSDVLKHGQDFCGFEVYSLEEAAKTGNKIIITASAYHEIAEILKARGFLEDIDYTHWKKFAGIYFWHYSGQLYSYQIDISVTQRCSLNCRHCNMWMPMFERPLDRDVDNILRDIDDYFSCVDYVSVVNLLGGEPFLYKRIPDIIKYIGQKWNDRIGEIQIYTNATVMPSEAVVNICAEYDVVMDISDYSNTLPEIKSKIKNFVSLMREKRIKYRLKTADEWLDFGFPNIDRQNDVEATTVFRLCRAPFRGLYEGKFYYCHLQASAEQLGMFTGNANDWIKLRDTDNARFSVLKLDLGYPELGYVTFCMRCDGCGKNNTRVVPVAEQTVKRAGIKR